MRRFAFLPRDRPGSPARANAADHEARAPIRGPARQPHAGDSQTTPGGKIAALGLFAGRKALHYLNVLDAGFRIFRCQTPGIQAVFARSAHTFEKHTHDEFGLGTIVEGGQRWHSGRGEVEAGPGAAISLNPGEVHDGTPVGADGRAWRMLYVDPQLLQATAREVFEGQPGDVEIPDPVLHDPRVATLVAALFVAETGAAETIRREELLLALTAGTARICEKQRLQISAPIMRAKTRIDDDPSSPVTLAELAEASGVSRFQLIRGFAKAIGLTPHAYLVQRRIEMARRLILAGELLAAAAAAAGFADQSHMTRIFVRKYGLSPGAFAKTIQ